MKSSSSSTPSAFTDLFIRKPVVALVINIIIIIAGLQAIGFGNVLGLVRKIGVPIPQSWTEMPGGVSVRQYPRTESASVVISTVYVGASAELVRGFVTTPIERAIASADGIDYVESK